MSIRIRTLAVALLACAFISESIGAPSLGIGDLAPDFTLTTIDGRSIRLNDLAAKSDIVLTVLRGWPGYQCPFCNEQAHDFVSRAAKFKAAGAQVVMVYPGPAEQLQAHAKEFISDRNWPKDFLLMLDPDYTFTKGYGLRWDAPNETAYPSTFVIEKDRKIIFSHVSREHGGRVKAEAVLKSLQESKLKSGAK